MKTIFLLPVLLFAGLGGSAQQRTTGGNDYGKHLASAKNAYQKNDLEDTHYQLMLSLQQLDMKVGEEILKIMPEAIDSLKSVKSRDQVTAMSGTIIGTSIHREYVATSRMEVDIVSNSPLVASLNAWLKNPILAGATGRKAMKLDGYKGSYTYETRDESDASGKMSRVSIGEMQIPVYSSLITIKCRNIPEDAFVKLMNTVPVSRIAEMLK